MADQRSGVDSGDYRDAIAGQKLLSRFVGTPVARQRREFADDQALNEWLHGFIIGIVGAVVADLRIGQDDNLAGVRRIGENFLIAGEGGIENNFSRVFDG